MKLSFRQGIVAAEMNSGLPPAANFLQRSTGDTRYIDLIANTRPTILAFAHGSSNYVVEERANVVRAWGPFENNTQTPYLYWDIDPITGALTRGFTLSTPISQQEWPNNVNQVPDQHWFDTTNNVMKVWNGSVWVKKIRVFAARVANSSTILYEPVGASSVSSLNQPCDAGYILSDGDGKPIRKNSQGEFHTSDDGFHLNFSQSLASVKLEGSEFIATAIENIPAFSVVSVSGENQIRLASSLSQAKEAIGLVQHDLSVGENAPVILRGIIYNPSWGWPADKIGHFIFCGASGELTTIRPESANVQKLGTILSPNSVLFQIDSQSMAPPPPDAAIQSLTVTSPLTGTAGPDIVLGINEVTITDAGIMSAADKVNLNNVVSGLTNEIQARTTADNALAPKTNPIFVGTVTLAQDPVTDMEAVTKQYADSLTAAGKEDVGVAAGLMSDHVAAADPHSQYVLDTDLVTAIAPLATTSSVTTAITNGIDAHKLESAAHPQYALSSTVTTDLGLKEDVGVAAGLMSDHVAAADPHSQYVLDTDLVTALTGKEAVGVAAGLMSTHVGDTDPHGQYLQSANLGTAVTALGVYATESYVNGKVDDLIAGAGPALDTLNELSAALNDDANFAGTIATSLTGKEAVGVAAGLMSDHVAAADPHGQYVLDTDLTTALSGKEDLGVAANAITAAFNTHNSAGNPHSQYGLASDLLLKVDAATAEGYVTAHVALPDPHSQYVLDTDLVTALTGKEAVGTAAGLMSTHVGETDPHGQYALISNIASYIPTTYLPLAGGTLTGRLLTVSGTVTAPGISLSANTNTGFYYDPSQSETSNGAGDGKSIGISVDGESNAKFEKRYNFDTSAMEQYLSIDGNIGFGDIYPRIYSRIGTGELHFQLSPISGNDAGLVLTPSGILTSTLPNYEDQVSDDAALVNKKWVTNTLAAIPSNFVSAAPEYEGAEGIAGQIFCDSNWLYICTGVDNWVRIAVTETTFGTPPPA